MPIQALTVIKFIQALFYAKRTIKSMEHAIAIFKVLAEIGAVFPKIGARVAEMLEAGGNPEDIEQMGYDAAKEIDIKVKVKGVDVVSEKAESHLLAAVGLILADIVKARA